MRVYSKQFGCFDYGFVNLDFDACSQSSFSTQYRVYLRLIVMAMKIEFVHRVRGFPLSVER